MDGNASTAPESGDGRAGTEPAPGTTLGVVRETAPGERRVAAVPGTIGSLTRLGLSVLVERGAGAGAGFPDEQFAARGALVIDRETVMGADILLGVRAPGTEEPPDPATLKALRPGQVVVGTARPLDAPEGSARVAERGATLFALELLPRITRAQSMDVLSSQATVAGYKAVLIAADRLPKMFPLLTTAAGTVTPARVLVVGAGVAGLQAIATGRRLGAVVEAYDVRPAAAEQIHSLGARVVELALDAGEAEGAGGYARAMDEAFYARQRELLAPVVARCDVVVTTAMVPGAAAPVLISTSAIEGMAPGSLVVDLAAPQGGNCEPTVPDTEVKVGGAVVLGPTNLPSAVPFHASQMFAKNAASFIAVLITDGRVTLDTDDEIVAATQVARDGRVVHPAVAERLGRPTGAREVTT
jgi:proton-translocating NAD(P)+ transhydrogenase subunit alpha